MDELVDILLNEGYVVATGGESVCEMLETFCDGTPGVLCSGYGVFPNGDICSGCLDCDSNSGTDTRREV
ncbi:MAG: hypothetical protein SVK08_02425 [Halobacteriota archaeon]|nr:hypothetical protein [Halobacteriota archaeon]